MAEKGEESAGEAGTAHFSKATRPVVTPNTYDGVASWTYWADHYEAVAKVNGWDDSTKLNWLPVRLTGKAQTAWKRLSGETKGDFQAAMDALNNRFEPSSKRERYAAEFRLRKKKNGEQWGDFADQLRCLADKAFPTLSEDAKEVLTLDRYLGELSDTSIALAVRQQRPETLEEAVSCTLEMESYALLAKEKPAGVAAVREEEKESGYDVCNVNVQPSVLQLLDSISKRLEKLECGRYSYRSSSEKDTTKKEDGTQVKKEVVCYRCGQLGHFARGCTLRSRKQGN
jgi:hypothetical protein